MNTFDFGEALKRLKTGKWVQRTGWNGRGMHVYLEEGQRIKIGGGAFAGQERVHEPCLWMFTAQGTHQPGWLCSQADMLAEDWEEVPSD